MRHVLDDGRTVYKLADFGTARELPEGENFTSLHGTEPYLHPQLYRVCFFQGGSPTREFGPNIDLWSIGVTLYQTATGNLPFLVQDRQLMLQIYTKMKDNEGIVSAVQNSDDVIFQKKLPKNCRLSFGLKQLVTPIIAGVFIQDKSRQWSFTKYYERVSEVVSRKLVRVFYINKMRLVKIYIKRDEEFNNFKKLILEQTEVSEENQVFLYKKNLIVSSFEDFRNFDKSEYIFLFDRSDYEVETTIEIQLIFENLTNFSNKFMQNEADDFRLAFITCRDLCLCKNIIEYQSIVYKCFTKFINDFNSYCKEETKDQNKMYSTLLEKNFLIKNRSLSRQKSLNLELLTKSFLDQSEKSFNELATIQNDVTPDNSHDSYLKTVSKELNDMKQLRKNLYNAKIDKKLYDFEKTKILHCVRTILETFTDKIDPNFEIFLNKIKNWYKNDFFAQMRSLSLLKKQINSYRSTLKQIEEEIQDRSHENSSFNKDQMLDIVTKFKNNNFSIKLLAEENLNLVEEIENLINVNLSTDL